MEMLAVSKLEVVDIRDGGFLEPWEVLKRKEILPLGYEQPNSVPRDIEYLSFGSAFSSAHLGGIVTDFQRCCPNIKIIKTTV